MSDLTADSTNARQQRLIDRVSGMVRRHGSPSAIQGVSAKADGSMLYGRWELAQSERVQTYLSADMLAAPSYFVQFEGLVLAEPFSLAILSRVQNLALGWDCVCRHLDVRQLGDRTYEVIALVQFQET